jgi:alpha-amylase/alpha-mannosidase (GH57 family)
MRYVCIHGHFYQPPRENPWTGRVPAQPSAAPFHDWNQRITAECYLANAENYERISFNFGPSLLHWFEAEQEALLQTVVEADRRARLRFGGHGPALAQAWGHAILPLCTARDRRTQVLWGLKEFAFRFGRQAEGFWLPETAVDTPTLETLSLHGVSFTVLAPHQAETTIDSRRPYWVRLPSGRRIAIFFYDGPLSAAIAFEDLLDNGTSLAARLEAAFGDDPSPQLVHVATDGETYGHHHRGGDRALTQALALFDENPDIQLTCYGEFLERHPPAEEVRIVERSSWSCGHELGRWSRHCGCAATESAQQHWRGPLRAAIAGLREATQDPWQARVSEWLVDPWAARDDWIMVSLRPSAARLDDFLERHARRELSPPQRRELAQLFELQQRLVQTETSCAWFFEDLARIETIQVLQYAARAIELGESLLGLELETTFVDTLAQARSNDLEKGDGRSIWKKLVRDSR